MLITHAMFINIFTQSTASEMVLGLRESDIVLGIGWSSQNIWSTPDVWSQTDPSNTSDLNRQHFSLILNIFPLWMVMVWPPVPFCALLGSFHTSMEANVRGSLLLCYIDMLLKVWSCITHPHGCGYPGQKAWHTCVDARLLGHGTACAPTHHPQQTIAAGLRQHICSYERTTAVPLASYERQYLISLHYSI